MYLSGLGWVDERKLIAKLWDIADGSVRCSLLERGSVAKKRLDCRAMDVVEGRVLRSGQARPRKYGRRQRAIVSSKASVLSLALSRSRG